MSFVLGIIALIAFWVILAYLAIKNFVIEDLKPICLIGAAIGLYYFAKAIFAIAIGA